MLYIAFSIGAARYAVGALEVERVVPLLELSVAPESGGALAGVCNYHGEPVRVVDLSSLAGGEPAARLLSTRLIIVKHAGCRIGLLAEGVTETARISDESWVGGCAARGT